MNLYNVTYTINDVPEFNTYCNSSSPTCDQDVSSFTEKVGSGFSMLIGLESNTNPRPTHLAVGIVNVDYRFYYPYAGVTFLDWYTYGIGGSNVSNLSSVSQNYNIYLDNVYIITENKELYEFANSGLWQIRSTQSDNLICSNHIFNLLEDYTAIASIFSLIIIIFIFGTIKGYREGTFNISMKEINLGVKVIVLSGLVVAFFFVIMVTIGNVIC